VGVVELSIGFQFNHVSCGMAQRVNKRLWEVDVGGDPRNQASKFALIIPIELMAWYGRFVQAAAFSWIGDTTGNLPPMSPKEY
jgi:hypothetical protein